MSKVIIRGYRNGALHFKEHADTGEAGVEEMVQRHGQFLTDKPGMIEIEFLDELDVQKRFFRMGTDPSMMVNPKVWI